MDVKCIVEYGQAIRVHEGQPGPKHVHNRGGESRIVQDVGDVVCEANEYLQSAFVRLPHVRPYEDSACTANLHEPPATRIPRVPLRSWSVTSVGETITDRSYHMKI